MMIKSRLGWLAAPLLIVVSGLAVAQQHGTQAPPKVSFAAHAGEIPFDLFRGNRVVINGTINHRPTDILLDTGASITTVDRAFARAIGLPEGRKVTARGAGGNVEAEVVSGVLLDVGGMRFTDMTVAIMDLAPVSRGIGKPLTVILGRDFFDNAVVSFNWASNKLRISARESFAPPAGATALTLKRKGPFNTIPVSIAGDAPIDALLDLGNGGALSMPRTYWGERPALSSLRYAEGRRGGVGGLHAARSATIPAVTLAGKTFVNVPATLSEGGNDHDATQMTNVGIGLLRQFHVDLDLGRDRIYLTPRSDAPPFERDRSGTRLDLVGDRLVVAFVSPQGPAATAGLKAGDEIVAVDGHKVTPKYYSSRDWARGPAGTRVALQRADGSTVTVTLQDYY